MTPPTTDQQIFTLGQQIDALERRLDVLEAVIRELHGRNGT
jgi:hypothetical protein